MDSGIYLGRVWGIPIRLHMSWFIIFLLVTWSLASGYFPQEYPTLGSTAYWLLGAVTSILFAASVLLHELGHSYMALRDGVPVRSVTLYLFGGLAQIEREPDSASSELRIAVAGPLTSLALAGFFGILFLLDRAVPFMAAPSAWLMRINFMLAAFNMIPGFPLDGGRVLRALVWGWTKSLKKATAGGGPQRAGRGFRVYGYRCLHRLQRRSIQRHLAGFYRLVSAERRQFHPRRSPPSRRRCAACRWSRS